MRIYIYICIYIYIYIYIYIICSYTHTYSLFHSWWKISRKESASFTQCVSTAQILSFSVQENIEQENRKISVSALGEFLLTARVLKSVVLPKKNTTNIFVNFSTLCSHYEWEGCEQQLFSKSTPNGERLLRQIFEKNICSLHHTCCKDSRTNCSIFKMHLEWKKNSL